MLTTFLIGCVFAVVLHGEELQHAPNSRDVVHAVFAGKHGCYRLHAVTTDCR